MVIIQLGYNLNPKNLETFCVSKHAQHKLFYDNSIVTMGEGVFEPWMTSLRCQLVELQSSWNAQHRNYSRKFVTVIILAQHLNDTEVSLTQNTALRYVLVQFCHRGLQAHTNTQNTLLSYIAHAVFPLSGFKDRVGKLSQHTLFPPLDLLHKFEAVI